MSAESTTPDLLELNRRAIEAVPRGDWEAAIGSYSPDSVWDGKAIGLGTYAGVITIRDAMKEWAELYEDFEIELEDNCDLGGGVILAVARQRGRPAGSSAYLEFRFASVTEWQDGLIVRVTPYSDIDEARAAAERLPEERG